VEKRHDIWAQKEESFACTFFWAHSPNTFLSTCNERQFAAIETLVAAAE
jgi:hypothetical protein